MTSSTDKNTIATQLLGESWAQKIGEEFKKKYLIKISDFLKEERKKKIIYPENDEDIFKVFRDLNFEDIRVVIIGQDPYHDGSYNGMAFANKEDTLRISPSLRNILKELEDDIGNGLILNPDITLKTWQKQGVFLINTALTVEKGIAGSHASIGWSRFVGEAIKALLKDKEKKVFIIWGSHAKHFLNMISTGINIDHIKIIGSAHPSPLSAYKGFFGSKPFSQTNEWLVKNNLTPILWAK